MSQWFYIRQWKQKSWERLLEHRTVRVSWDTAEEDQRETKYIPTQAEIGDYALFLGKAGIEIEIENKKYLIVAQSAILILIRDDLDNIIS